jgi:hypothetical protein
MPLTMSFDAPGRPWGAALLERIERALRRLKVERELRAAFEEEARNRVPPQLVRRHVGAE